ncbi:hypothetical protein [Sinorhizobium meliloti]|uniref:hypothetical protein n=1 Tax=Rhizobium meliloti TaxID=382 RepID=UPI002380591C|nr:hypothetical protein [Sinorhizobium meliloti]
MKHPAISASYGFCIIIKLDDGINRGVDALTRLAGKSSELGRRDFTGIHKGPEACCVVGDIFF